MINIVSDEYTWYMLSSHSAISMWKCVWRDIVIQLNTHNGMQQHNVPKILEMMIKKKEE